MVYTSNESYKQVEFDFLENGRLISEKDNQFQLSWFFVQISCWQNSIEAIFLKTFNNKTENVEAKNLLKW